MHHNRGAVAFLAYLLTGVIIWRHDHMIVKVAGEALDEYDVYDGEMTWDDVNERYVREVEGCDEVLPPPSVQSEQVLATSALVKWSKVPDADRYEVAVKSPKSDCARGEGSTNETEAPLRDLDSDTAYVIEVTAHNVNSCSTPQEITFSTGIGSWKCAGSGNVPGPVTNINIPLQNVTSSGALVSWNPSPKGMKYKVTLDPTHEMFYGLGETKTESTVIGGLDPGTSYSVTVAGMNGADIGESASKSFITRLEEPGNFLVSNVSKSFLKVSWEKPQLSNYFVAILSTYSETDESFLVKKTNTTKSFVYFLGLNSAQKYRIQLVAHNFLASSPMLQRILFTKLPKTTNISISDVTDHSVFAQWLPVEGALTYCVILKNYHDGEVVKKYTVTGTSHKLDDLNAASKYELEVIAQNEQTDSLPAVQIVFTRLEQIEHLNVDKEYVQDTSLVVRWERKNGAEWYEVVVEPNTPGILGAGDIEKREYTKIENLIPGTSYTITVTAQNHPVFDTDSLPSSVQQFTRLSKPMNLSAPYEGTGHNSIEVTWSPVKHAKSYLLLVYDCSGVDRTVGPVSVQENKAPIATPEKYASFAKWWRYKYTKVESLKLQCEKAYKSVEQAVKEGERMKPSRVVGQGRTTSPHATLTNLRPGTRYEILVVSGTNETQSNPSVILKYTKLVQPGEYAIERIESSSVYLKWNAVSGAEYYRVDILYTPIVEGVSKLKKASIKPEFVKTMNVTKTSVLARPLLPTTNYTFKLTACDTHTESFPQYATTFTRLTAPQTLNAENLTTSTLLLQWNPVDHAAYYNITYVARKGRSKRQNPHYLNVTKARIYLDHLSPNTLYEISITAQNKYTRSLPSPFNTYTELPVPANFTVVDVTDSTIHLTWSDVEGRQSFKLAKVIYPRIPETLRERSDKPSKVFEFLTANTPYRILMKAWNPNTESKVSEIIQYTKLPRPQQVVVREVSNSRLRIRWQAVENADLYSLIVYPLFNESQPTASDSLDQTTFTDVIQLGSSGTTNRARRSKRMKRTAHGEPGGGDISFITFISLKRNGRRYEVVESNRSYADLQNTYYINVTASEVVFNHLEPSVKYKVFLRAINRNTDSLPVVLQTFTELEKPRSVEVKDVTNDTMLIRWLAVEKANYYQVRIRPEAKFWSNVPEPSGIGNTSSTEVTVKGLHPNTNYTITVMAGNDHVVSKKTAIWKITKLSPTENLRVVRSSVKHDRFHLKWNTVTFASKYVIIITPPTRDHKSIFEFSSAATEATVTRLRDGTLYHVIVSGQNARTEGVERSIMQYTKLLTPDDVIIVKDSVTSSSFELRWLPVPSADEYSVVIGNRTDAFFRVTRVKTPAALIDGLSSGELYNATITAQNLTLKTYSESVTVKSYTKLQTPTNFSIPDLSITDRSMLITWDPVPLAHEYLVKVGIETREDDHILVVLHLQKQNFRVPFTSVSVRNLHPASFYKVEMKAINRNTESFTVSLKRFTKLPSPRNVTLVTQPYMDTEAEIEWKVVQHAEYYRVQIYEVRILNETQITDGDQGGEYGMADGGEEEDYDDGKIFPTLNLTLVETKHVDQISDDLAEAKPYNLVKGLKPVTTYQAMVQAINKDTYSSQSKLDFITKTPCSGDFYLFPNTHLANSIPRKSVTTETVGECLQICCEERSFQCLSVSVHHNTSACLLYEEDRNTAPPLTISRTYDHYERKFWQEVSGFQIRSITHNNVAVMNETVELTLTFVYLGGGGCVHWDFGDGGVAYHSILGSNCSHFCRDSDDVNCTVIDTNPNSNSNQIKVRHDYDMETVFEVIVNVSDSDTYEISSVNVAINERGCIYPAITIEEEGKNINDPKRMFRSHKLLMSATPTIICNNFPGVQFLWGAISFAEDKRTAINSFPLQALGSEIMVPALTFPLGLYRVSVAITVLDEQHDLTAVDAIYLLVEASPLVAQIKGGTMRTVGANRIVTWDAESVSYDPDLVSGRGEGLSYNWFCQNYTDDKMLLLNSGSCFKDMEDINFSGPGKFSLNTSHMHLYVEYQFRVLVSKGDRTNSFRQQIIVKEGDPPDFQIKCAENCKTKMNPTQSLGLQAICYNCKEIRRPRYKWTLYEVVLVSNGTHTNNHSLMSEASADGKKQKEIYVEILGWEKNSTTNSSRPIVVLNKNALVGGRKYVMRINISMDGLDDRVFSFSDFEFLTNLPPYGGECTTAASIGNCKEFIPFKELHLTGVEPKKVLDNSTFEKCSQHCCLTRVFMCLSVSFDRRTSQCLLFDHNKESAKRALQYHPYVDHYQRLFYKGGAVVDEVIFECRNWKDEGQMRTYPKEGERLPKSTLTYKFTTVPQTNKTQRLLLYFGNVLLTPGISMALGDPSEDYGVTVIAQVCDMYGECALSNVIYLQIVPPDSKHMGLTLSGITSGNASKLAILSNTGNSKAAAQLVQSISSLINMDEEDEVAVRGNQTATNLTTTQAWTTTQAPTTVAVTTAATPRNASNNGSLIAKNEKKNLRSDVVTALSAATSGMTSIDNLQQMTSAMSAITRKTDEVDEGAQKQAASTVKRMAGSLSQFAGESNKEDVTSAASDIVGSLGSVAKASETDMGQLKSQLMERTEIDYGVLDQRDLSPDEYEYYNKKKLKDEKRRVRRSALGSQDVVENAVEAMESTATALLNKQMEGEPPVDVSSNQLEMKVEKTSPRELSNRDLSTNSGTSIKLPDANTLLGNNATNLTEPVDMQVTAFKENPFGFGEDAALINSPVTMLRIGGNDGNHMESVNDTDDDTDEKPGIGVSIPNKFDSQRDMVTVVRSINDTGLSISKFEVISTNNAILIVVEPEDERAEFQVFIRHQLKPTEELHDYQFSLPHKLWKVDSDTDLFKIFIPEKEVTKKGVFFIGIKDKLNVTQISPGARVRRRRSVGMKNTTIYHLLIATPGCRKFDQKKKSWARGGCRVDTRSTPEVTECICSKLSATSVFSAEFFVPPNTINFATVWAKVDIADNPAVFSTVISFIILYVIMLVWANRMDVLDAKKWALKSTLDNRKEDKHLYQVTVFTGHGRYAATTSKVSCVIFGANGKSRVRQLKIKEDLNPFARSSVVHFLIRESKDLGELTHAHVWHDNSGKGENRSWYLDQVVVQNVRLGKRYFFICDEWLAVDHGDGKVDRILPVATPENMSAFHRLFVSTTTQKFTEDHLWISLFYRPTKSNFTRMQRLSCCICLLFVTMIANAMFFERGASSDKSGTASLSVGPFTVSPLQLWTSFCSTLMVVPITTTIMTLFKKAKTKEQEKIDKEEKETIANAVRKFNRINKRHQHASSLPDPSDIRGCDAVYTINADGTINTQPNTGGVGVRNRVAQWPHWVVYIAWFLTWVAVILSGFFAILYSFEWGREKANRWLANMMLSFWQSVLIVQPIKVIILAMFVAAVLKKPDQNALDSVDPREVKEAERKFVNLCADNIEAELQSKEADNLAAPKPPSKRKLRKARKLREKEKKMSQIIWEVISYFFYIMVLLFLCHGTRDSVGQLINEQMKKTFVDSTFGLKSANTVEHFWRFVRHTVLPNLYSNEWYNGQRKSWRDRSFLTDEQSFRVGPARLRQLRLKSDSCPVVGTSQKPCHGSFSMRSEERGDYLPGWKKNDSNFAGDLEDIDPADPAVIAWKHRNWRELKGVPFMGEIAVYPGGGYSAELGVNYESGVQVVDSLFRDAWIDHQTRAVFTEFTAYNPNVNLFTCVQLVTEFPPVGAAVTFTSIVTFRLYQYLGAYGTVMVIAQIIFVLHLFHSTYTSIRTVVRKRRHFFEDPWDFFDVMITCMDWAIASLYVFRVVLTNITINAFHENKRKFVNFQQVMTVDSMVANALALSAFFGIVRFLKLLRFNRKTGMLAAVMRNSAKQWPGFLLLALVFFIAFAHIGYLIFCPYLDDFRNIVTTVETMFSTMMGRPIYKDLRNLYRVFGPTFYFIFCFTSSFVILNVLIAIINESYGITLEGVSQTKNEYEMIDFMLKRFAKWTGISMFHSQKEKKVKPPRVSGEDAPLPPLPYKIETNENQQILNVQKQLDKYLYDLETKYSKYVTVEELRDEVVGEMSRIPDGAQNNPHRRRNMKSRSTIGGGQR